VSDLVTFLLARLVEDDRKAMQVYRVDWNDPDGWAALHGLAREHAQNHNPARVLREVESKRRIVGRYQEQVARQHENAMEEDRAWTLEPVLRDLASVYADHPDYDESWRP
jgi:uncharacterized protein DUF6221